MSHIQTQKHPRFRVAAPVAVLGERARMDELTTENVSLGGAFVKTEEPFQPGSTVHLRLRMREATIVAAARVVHVITTDVAPQKNHPPGMGIVFEALSPLAQRSLERFVTGLAHQGHADAAIAAGDDVMPREETAVELELRDLLALATEHERRGELLEARQTLLCARELAPFHDGVRACLRLFEHETLQAEALRTVEAAWRDASGPDVIAQVLAAVQHALALSPTRTTRSAALHMLAESGLLDEGAELARTILEQHGEDEQALRVLLDVHERRGEWALARQTAVALHRLRPDDLPLVERMVFLSAASRG